MAGSRKFFWSSSLQRVVRYAIPRFAYTNRVRLYSRDVHNGDCSRYNIFRNRINHTEWETPIQSAASCDHFPPNAVFELEAIGSPTLGVNFSGNETSAVVIAIYHICGWWRQMEEEQLIHTSECVMTIITRSFFAPTWGHLAWWHHNNGLSEGAKQATHLRVKGWSKSHLYKGPYYHGFQCSYNPGSEYARRFAPSR